MRRLLILGLVLLFAAGCVKASVQYLSPETFAPIPVDSVTIFMTPDELEADSIAYMRVAIIHLKGDQSFTSQESIYRKAREEAAKLGCNGLVIPTVEEGKTTWNWLSGTSTSQRQAQAFAIRWWVKSKP